MSSRTPLLRYHALTHRPLSPDGAGPTGHGSPLGAAIELAPVVLELINKGLLALRLRSCLKDLQPSIARVMPERGGVLIVYTTQWWENSDLGTRVENLLEPPAIAATGSSAHETYLRWLRQPRFTQAPPQGWNLTRHFLWTTR